MHPTRLRTARVAYDADQLVPQNLARCSRHLACGTSESLVWYRRTAQCKREQYILCQYTTTAAYDMPVRTWCPGGRSTSTL
eukprot:1954548-Rhodomonas_salina.1